MPVKKIYLDYAAATPVDTRVMSAMAPFWQKRFGNAGSQHSFGFEAKQALDQSRKTIAKILTCSDSEIYFTNGGTQSINAAIIGSARAMKQGHIITSAIEHSAVLKSVDWLRSQGYTVTVVPVQNNGLVDIKKILSVIKPDTFLISLMLVNNEIGTIQPVTELGKELTRLNRTRKNKGLKQIYFHTDACQAGAYLSLNVNKLHVDLLSLSGSKLYAPKGIGLLYIRHNVPVEPITFGGGQERTMFSGTENIPAIVGLATGLSICQKELTKETIRLSKLRNYFIQRIEQSLPQVLINGDLNKRVANNVNLSFAGYEGETMVLKLDRLGIACSTGSACSETSGESSHVLRAIGLSTKQAGGSLRFSLGRFTTKPDIDRTIKALISIIRD